MCRKMIIVRKRKQRKQRKEVKQNEKITVKLRIWSTYIYKEKIAALPLDYQRHDPTIRGYFTY